jgi:hypothetical protein
VRRLLVIAYVVPGSSILVTLNMDALHSFKTSFIARVTLRNSPKDGILQFSLRFTNILGGTGVKQLS